MTDPMVQEFLTLLELATNYVTAAEAVIDGLLGKLDAKDRREAEEEIRRRLRDYKEARTNIVTFAREREAMLA